MTAKLPVGFVQNSADISNDIRRIPKVPVEDITKLWKGKLDDGCWEPSIADSSL